MIISEDTKQVIEFIGEVFPDSISNINELTAILEIGATFGLHELINDLVFTAASIQYLKKTIISSPISNNSTDKMKIEFQRSIQDLRDMMGKINRIALDNKLDINFDQYLEKNQGSVEKLLSLSSDLSLIKEVQNKLKHQKTNFRTSDPMQNKTSL
jgi:predicted translin family RNA/ssDNA-binding protein